MCADRSEAPTTPARVLILTALPELLKFVALPPDIADKSRQILYGLALIAMLLLRPQGLLPEIPARRRLPLTTSSLFGNNGLVDVEEAIQRLRTNVEFAADGALVFAVTSSVPGEGKSTVTASA